jgi:hypothetical protein
MEEERRIAKERGYKDPINVDIDATAACYDKNVQFFMKNKSPNSEILVASHNEASVEKVQDFLKTLTED